MTICVRSFAKINWSLRVLGRRHDGFHEVSTVLQTIDLSDEISFVRSGTSVTLEVRGRNLSSGPENLVRKAAALLEPYFKIDTGLRIHLEKRVPIGAGLGGGSSNAAVTLLMINEIAKCGLSPDELLELASELGSDTVFFLHGGTALGTGRGEIITELPDVSGQVELLLLYPCFEVSAGQAYSLLNASPVRYSAELTSDNLDTTIRRFHGVPETGNWDLRNDLEGPVLVRYPVLKEYKTLLLNEGCDRVMLSGSGSTLIGLGDPLRLNRVATAIEDRRVGEVFLCRTVTRSGYRKSFLSAGLNLVG